VDFSNASHAAAELALDLANTHGARLHMLHVYEDVLPPAYSQRVFEWDPKLKQRGEFALEKFMNTHRARGVKMEMHLLEGRAFRSIVDFSKEASIDLIVMGTAGLTGVHHFMVGSVTEKVLRNADVPVLTVRAGASSDK
jgi:nucleotide-binding universal stress UspA family protein